MLFGDIDVPKDVVWLILRQVIADLTMDRFMVPDGKLSRFLEQGHSIGFWHAKYIGLTDLTRVCWVFRSVILSRRQLIPGGGFLFIAGSF
jgi:hypothetical protein